MFTFLFLVTHVTVNSQIQCQQSIGPNQMFSTSTCNSLKGYTLVSCGIKSENTRFYKGTQIKLVNNQSTCAADSQWVGNKVISVAHCCNLTLYGIINNNNCLTLTSTESIDMANAYSSILCPISNPLMFGCHMYGNKDNNGACISDTNTSCVSVPRTSVNANYCVSMSTFTNDGMGVQSNINCCKSTKQVSCISKWSTLSKKPRVSCDVGYTLMDCNTYHNDVYRFVNEYYIENNECVVNTINDTGNIGVYAVATCCQFTNINIVSISPTNIPTQIPTIYPTNVPTKNPIYTITPTINPTKIPSKTPTLNSTNIPTFNPTNIPSLNPSQNVNSTNTTSIMPSLIPTINPTILPTKIENTIINNTKVTQTPSLTPTINIVKNTTFIKNTNNSLAENKKKKDITILVIIITISLIILIICTIIVIRIYCKYQQIIQQKSLDKHVQDSQIKNGIDTQLNQKGSMSQDNIIFDSPTPQILNYTPDNTVYLDNNNNNEVNEVQNIELPSLPNARPTVVSNTSHVSRIEGMEKNITNEIDKKEYDNLRKSIMKKKKLSQINRNKNYRPSETESELLYSRSDEEIKTPGMTREHPPINNNQNISVIGVIPDMVLNEEQEHD